MIHNGIEYAEMQLIAEVYGILRHALDYKPDEIAIFSKWNKKKKTIHTYWKFQAGYWAQR